MSMYEKVLSMISVVCFGFCLALLIVSTPRKEANPDIVGNS